MADEVTVTVSLAFAKGGTSIAYTSGELTFDVSGTHYFANTQEIGAGAYEALDMGSNVTPGWVFMRNLDATNFVEIKGATGDGAAMLKLKATECGVFRMVSTAPYAQADSAAVDLEYIIIDD